ncbi:aromatic ring-hydroxylating dioxygenase subunit alpha [Leptolyngbya sp. FACHB-261]|uniref:aromatic ring-hydroxylating oxygenase subunit alpha n=1 Tax=Leptolyngbya sp. FACHB-261 TaxID=2692806 RepID=UPI0016822123|nr:aromatic ring-hydroxylating dioxygenase subunit alpha [Leptolyngbya sp. FACHB-261]MBD2102259.1 aromatic ring-hydroxylating dioxygenase subunit alpha [Leptolyngbya sp. FACHB-261]
MTTLDRSFSNRAAATGDQAVLLRNLWYYALPAHQLKPGTMLAKSLLGEPVLLARSRTGKVFALRDICPHRAVPLSCGRFDGQEVECCYHGWRFDSTGRCTAIPSLTDDQDLDLSRFRVQQYPLREVQGNLWIYMGDGTKDQSPDEAEIPVVPSFGNQPHQLVITAHFPCSIDHAVVGLMDPAHSPFVHRAWWWRSGKTQEEVKTFDPSPYGFTMRRHKIENMGHGYRLLGGIPETEIAFRLPGVRIEHISTGQHTVCNLTTVTPLSETETEVTTSFYWTTPWLTALKPVLKPLVQAFLNQDRDVVAKQQVGLKHNPGLMLIRDADTQARWYYQLKAEFLRATAEGRPFVNPVKEQVLRWRG